jgi:iron complex outermembrane receptor protein
MGFEVQGAATLARRGATAFVADGSVDYVRARIVGAGPAPRIPPLRVLGGLEAQSPRAQGRVEVEWSRRQNRVQEFETTTQGFTMVNASVSIQPFASNRTNLVLSANNLFDVVARRHASFLKDYAPLAGRDLRATLRVSF